MRIVIACGVNSIDQREVGMDADTGGLIVIAVVLFYVIFLVCRAVFNRPDE